jgi:hypothetical protein
MNVLFSYFATMSFTFNLPTKTFITLKFLNREANINVNMSCTFKDKIRINTCK